MEEKSHTAYRTATVDGLEVFYREAGDPGRPTMLLLHGFPTSSHMFRDLLPLLSGRFHLVAPDLPGFGHSALPSRAQFTYSFQALADVIGRFTEVIGLERYGLYVFDYGAPVGFRLARAHPERITTIVTQNGNAYEEGLSDGWEPIRRYWREPTSENRDALRVQLGAEFTRWQYEHGVPDKTLVSPDGWTLDGHFMQRPGVDEIMLDLFLDYSTNVAAYPKFQRYLREHQPRLLAIWGENDPFFLPAGAQAYLRDLPAADIRFLNTGHFALETHAAEIAEAICSLL